MKDEFKVLPKNKDDIANLIFRLKDGKGIWFSSHNDITRGSGCDEWVEKMVEGDEYVYKQGTDPRYREYLETEEDINRYAQEIASNPRLNYYTIQSIQGYVRPEHNRYEDDQALGHYELYGADRPEPQYESKKVKMKQQLLEYLIRACVKEVLSTVSEGDEADAMSDQDQELQADRDFKDFEKDERKKQSKKNISKSPKRSNLKVKGVEVDEEEDTIGAASPPADRQGTADQPEIPKSKDQRPEDPSNPETPGQKTVLKGIFIINPRDKSKLQKVSINRTTDDASLERSLYQLASKNSGSNIKVSISTIREIKNALKNPNSSLYLYIGKLDPESDELFLLADRSVQIAKDGSISPAEITPEQPSYVPEPKFDPYTSNAADIAQQAASGGKTVPQAVNEELRNTIKNMINKTFDNCS